MPRVTFSASDRKELWPIIPNQNTEMSTTERPVSRDSPPPAAPAKLPLGGAWGERSLRVRTDPCHAASHRGVTGPSFGFHAQLGSPWSAPSCSRALLFTRGSAQRGAAAGARREGNRAGNASTLPTRGLVVTGLRQVPGLARELSLCQNPLIRLTVWCQLCVKAALPAPV